MGLLMQLIDSLSTHTPTDICWGYQSLNAQSRSQSKHQSAVENLVTGVRFTKLERPSDWFLNAQPKHRTYQASLYHWRTSGHWFQFPGLEQMNQSNYK